MFATILAMFAPLLADRERGSNLQRIPVTVRERCRSRLAYRGAIFVSYMRVKATFTITD